jgi:transposase
MPAAKLPIELWEQLEPLLPPDEKPGPHGGRPRVLNIVVMRGIYLVLCTGIRWEEVPLEIGCSGMTCWRRLHDWQQAGIWEQLHRLLLAALRKSDQLDLSLTIVDSGSIRAVGAGESTGPNPTDRRKPGTKHHLLVDRHGVPLEIRVTGANRHDVLQIIPLVVNMPRIAGKVGHPLVKPKRVQADRAYDDESARALLDWLGIDSWIARRNSEHGSGLGKSRWVVERTISWLRGFRRLRVRYDRRDDIHCAWNELAASAICCRILHDGCAA